MRSAIGEVARLLGRGTGGDAGFDRRPRRAAAAALQVGARRLLQHAERAAQRPEQRGRLPAAAVRFSSPARSNSTASAAAC